MLHMALNWTNFVNLAGLLNIECILPLKHSRHQLRAMETIFDASSMTMNGFFERFRCLLAIIQRERK
jgi:hypothetical protein